MSAIWGHIDFGEKECHVTSMASEYRRKCKLDRITETPFKNAIFGSGLQIINDEDEFEEMPYIIDNGNVIVTADVILDNRDELIEELLSGDDAKKAADDAAKKIPDGRLICLAYEKWGYDLARHFKGIFSIAIYNAGKEELFICTDQTASRCLYYYKDEKGCTFSTLASPIKEVADLRINKLYIQDFLAVPDLTPSLSATETPWENVFLVEAGTYIVISSDTANIERYYYPRKVKVSRNKNEFKNQFVSVYKAATKALIRSNKDIAICLSSGLDSSSVCSLAAPMLAEQGKKIKSYTYTPYYKDGLKVPANLITDETELVKLLAKRYPNIETHFENNDGRDLTLYFEELLDVLEIPYKSYINLPVIIRIFERAYNEGCRVMINGQCGNTTISYGKIDEVFYHLIKKHKYVTYIRYFSNYCKLVGASRKRFFVENLKFYLKFQNDRSSQAPDSESENNPFVNQDILQSFDRNVRSEFADLFNHVLTTESQYIKKLYYTPAYAYIGVSETKTGLYTGTVIRDATRNIDVLNFCNSIPFEYFCIDGTPRALIRYCMEDYVPYELRFPISRRGLQSADWLQRLAANSESVNKRLDELIGEKLNVNSEFLDKNKIEDFLKKKPEFTENNSQKYLFFFHTIVANLFLISNS